MKAKSITLCLHVRNVKEFDGILVSRLQDMLILYFYPEGIHSFLSLFNAGKLKLHRQRIELINATDGCTAQ